MKVTEFTSRALIIRRHEQTMIADGWERIGEGGGKLWELCRGGPRTDHEITDVRLAADGRSLWIKTAKREA